MPKELRSYLLDNGWLWGEWLEPGQDVVPYMVNLMTHGDLELSSAYLSYGCALVAEMAESLGKIRGCGIFSRGQREGEGGLPVSVSENGEIEEPKAAVPLCPSHRAGDADGGGKARTAESLAEKIAENGGKLNTGFFDDPTNSAGC